VVADKNYACEIFYKASLVSPDPAITWTQWAILVSDWLKLMKYSLLKQQVEMFC
jgi:hypothetical protein